MERAVSIVPKTFFLFLWSILFHRKRSKQEKTHRADILSFSPPVGRRRRRNTIFTVQDLKIELTKNVFPQEKNVLYNPLFYIVVHLLNEAEEFRREKGLLFFMIAQQRNQFFYIFTPLRVIVSPLLSSFFICIYVTGVTAI